MDVLLTYIAGSSVSLLENTLVEKEELCSAVYHYQESRPDSVVWFTLSAVATELLASVEKRFFEVLRDAVNKPLDMAYMKECIKRYRRGIIYAAESSTTIFSEPLIEDHLFGARDGKEFEDAVKSLKVFDTLMGWSDQQWRDFLSKYLAYNNHISILGVPSEALSKKLKSDEKARVKAQQEKLGEEGLAKLTKKLEEAKAENDREIPKEVIAKFKVPSPDSIHFIPSVTARSGYATDMGRLDNDAQKMLDKDQTDLPLFIHFENVPTNFVHFSLLLSTSPVPLELKPLLSVYLDNFLTTPILRDGTRVEFEQVVMELEKDTISYAIEKGSTLGCGELIRIKFVVEREKYPTAIKWLRDLCFNSLFEPERLKPTLAKTLADIPDAKRSGYDMLAAVNAMIHYSPPSASRAQGTLVRALYLKRIAHMLRSAPQDVLTKLEDIRKKLLTFSNMRVFVTADLSRLEKPVSTWEIFTKPLDTKEPLRPLDTRTAVLSDAARHPGSRHYLIPMPTIDSSFALFTAKGVDSYDHPKLPALMVAISYLDAVEGPLWVAVRGTGLAYGTNFNRGTDTGLVDFNIYRSPDAYKAYSIAKEVVTDFATGKREFDEFALEGAVSSIVMSFAEEQPTMFSAAAVGFINQVVRGIPKDWGSKILREVREVTPDEIKDVMQSILLPIFEPKTANVVVTCATIMEHVSSRTSVSSMDC
jgi:Zn-dependent M16 (insulinase) family peptidase